MSLKKEIYDIVINNCCVQCTIVCAEDKCEVVKSILATIREHENCKPKANHCIEMF